MFKNSEGQRIPDVTFKTRSDSDWVDVTSAQLFNGKTVVVFALPGAFTPTCSSAHVPRYNELAPVFKAHGVDDIVCISVNDAFVMNEWRKDQRAEHIRFIPDGNGEFTAAMQMLVDKESLGFGKRSWRYAMLVKDGVIDKMFIEQDVPGDPYEVSDADTMLAYISPSAVKPLDVTLFTKPGCPFCARAKSLLADNGMDYEEIVLGSDVTIRSVRAASGADKVPQIFIDGTRIGGSDELQSWLAAHERIAA